LFGPAEMTSLSAMQVGLRVVPVNDGDAMAAHADEWAALLERSASNRHTQTPLWLLAWWRVFGCRDGRRLASALVYDGPRLVGLAPMLRRLSWHRRAIPFRRLELIAMGEAEEDEIASDYIGVIAERGYEDGVTQALAEGIARGALGGCDEVVLSALDGELSIGAMLAQALARHGMAVDVQPAAASPYIRLTPTWDAYLAALAKAGRYQVNRSLRDFEDWAGADAELVRVRSAADLEEGKRVLVQLHEQRWQAAGRRGVFASPLFTRFHDAVLPELLERGALDLCWLEVRGRPIAASYNVVWDNKVLVYQNGRALDVPKGVRPGIVLHARSIQAAIAAGRSEYDFLPGESCYKRQLATASRPMLQIRAARAPLRELASAALERGVTFVRRWRTAASEARTQVPRQRRPALAEM